jgi:phosphopentomutase
MPADNRTTVVMITDAVGMDLWGYLLACYHGNLSFPNFSKLGLGSLLSVEDSRIPDRNPVNFATTIKQASFWPDSQVGHQEIVGVFDQSRYILFPKGFGEEFRIKLEEIIGRDVIYNEMAGGSEAIMDSWRNVRTWKTNQLGNARYPDKSPVVLYASVCDPLMQIAMPDDEQISEEYIPVKEQKQIGQIAFDLAMELGIKITRVITRPYKLYIKNTDKLRATLETPDENIIIDRTSNRHDIIPELKKRTLIDVLNDNGIYTIGVGKAVEMIPGLSENVPRFQLVKKRDEATEDEIVNSGFWPTFQPAKDKNPLAALDLMEALDVANSRNGQTFIYATFGDTDSVYGHNMQIEGTLRSLQSLDSYMPKFLMHLKKGDKVIITADHSMKHVNNIQTGGMVHVPHPSQPYGYHNNEPLPLLLYIKGEYGLEGCEIKSRSTLAVVGHIVAQAHGVAPQFVEECHLQEYFN